MCLGDINTIHTLNNYINMSTIHSSTIGPACVLGILQAKRRALAS